MSHRLTPGDGVSPWTASLQAVEKALPLKYLVAIDRRKLSEQTHPSKPIRYIDIGSVSSLGEIDDTQLMSFENAPSRARRLPAVGDTIVSTVRTYLRAIAHIDQLPEDETLVCSTGFAVISPGKELHPKFLSYCLRTHGFVEEIVARSTGVSYPAINPPGFNRLPIPVVPLKHQRAIADFLDRKTAMIDELVNKKERLIELLQEKRQALITQAVTKGLDPNVPMKDSGIEWLGEIPAHWEVRRLKQVSDRVVVGIAEAATHAYTENGGVPIVRSTNLRPNILDISDLLHVEKWFADRNRSKYVRAGDLLTQRTGEYSGMTAVVPENLDWCQCFTMIITTPGRTLDGRFVSRYIESQVGGTYFDLTRWGSAQPNISVPIVKEMPLPCPPLSEQVAILNWISEIETQDPAPVLRSQIQRLREYRQALISSAVTGRLSPPEAP